MASTAFAAEALKSAAFYSALGKPTGSAFLTGALFAASTRKVPAFSCPIMMERRSKHLWPEPRSILD